MNEKATKREKLSLRRDVAEASSYSTEPKVSADQERITPVRNQGEPELRLHMANADIDSDLLNGNQLLQSLIPRGYPTDINPEIFAQGPQAARFYHKQPLSDVEYHQRKMYAVTPDPSMIRNPNGYFSRCLGGYEPETVAQALADHYGKYVNGHWTVAPEAQYGLGLLLGARKRDDLKAALGDLDQLYHSKLLDFFFRPEKDELKIRQSYLDQLSGVRLPRFLVPDTTEFPYDPGAHYIGLMLPYRRCLFILNPGVNARLVYCEQLADDKIKLTVKVSTHGEAEAIQIGEFQFEWADGKLIEKGWFSDEFTKATAQELRCILSILDGLSKNYVVAEGDPPPAGRKIPEARKGCTVRVVKLHPQSETIRKEWQGGTHASPREHTRQGHWKRSRAGKRIWISEVIVNKGKTDGVVDKDYYIRKKESLLRKYGNGSRRTSGPDLKPK